jgi:hypothetical protein
MLVSERNWKPFLLLNPMSSLNSILWYTLCTMHTYLNINTLLEISYTLPIQPLTKGGVMRKFSASTFCLLFIISFSTSGAFGAYFKGLGKLPGDTGSYAFTVSPDGNFVAGGSEGVAALAEAFRWTESQGMVGLSLISGYTESTEMGV